MHSVPNEKNQHRFESNKKYFTISIYALAVIAISTIFIYMVMHAKQTKAAFLHFLQVISPFLTAFFIAYILNPVIQFIEDHIFSLFLKNKKIIKLASIFTCYLFVLTFITIFLFYITPQIAKSLSDLTNKIPSMYQELLIFFQTLSNRFPNYNFSIWEQKLQKLIPDLLNLGTDFMTELFPFLYTLSLSIVKLFINILLSIVISCYMLMDQQCILKGLKQLIYAILPQKRAAQFCKTSKECNLIFSNFIAGKFIDSLIIGILCFFLMYLLRLPYILLISVIIGITNMIPYFGPFIGAIPSIFILLFISPLQAFIFFIMIFLLQQFDGLILGPKILGNSTGLKPLWIILGITLGGAYGGVLGMFLGVPFTAVIAYLCRQLIQERLKQKNIPF